MHFSPQLSKLFVIKDHKYSTRRKNDFFVSNACSSLTQNFFKFVAPRLWNSLPTNLKVETNFIQFRRKLFLGRNRIDICNNCTEGCKVWA